MKRSVALRQLSREHHTALSLALHIAKATGPEARNALLATVPVVFRDELEPHFQAEERSLLPPLAQQGETALVERTLAEHAQLRALAAAIGAGEASALAPFGTLLQAHVRFEERELFAVAEVRLYAGSATDNATD
ncbi:MAG: hemerythrin domain-containing protein [Azonexus sp.]|jgi:hemerythrin-like domain-containing protein|uniref:hemerythrin domain-containing protein n=1 Tax=Azonexus sp. TaxID=1872668 RepID=UPI0028371711|nr:hemerythrin domain-containing protein [Azonexus sp.]MDR0775858.1 hemerythrin domain-containing protein [Azonexus sp.]